MYFLGVDGGGTKTAFALINEKGDILSVSNLPTCNYIQIGVENFKKVLYEGISQVCKQSGINISDIDFSFLGIPSYGENDKDVLKLESAVEEVLQSKAFRCGNDVEAGWAGSLACEPGINLVAGTGAIGFGRDQYGNTARASGWGYFCGDEGSAYWIGKKTIELFSKEADGRMGKSPIYDIMKEEFKLVRDFDLISVIYDVLKFKRNEIAKIQILLNKAADQGDENAIRVYREAAYENSLTVKSIINQLSFDTEQDIIVSYSGGVFKAGKYIIDPLKEYVYKENVRLEKAILLPVIGSALFALKLYGKEYSKEVVDNLRRQQIQQLGSM